jgi:hypothetical protein
MFQFRRLQQLKRLLRNLQVLPLCLRKLGRVLAPPCRCCVLMGNIVRLRPLGFQQPPNPMVIDGHEVQVFVEPLCIDYGLCAARHLKYVLQLPLNEVRIPAYVQRPLAQLAPVVDR